MHHNFLPLLSTLLTLTLTTAQHVTVPAICTPGFTPGSDTVLYTTPYTYSAVLSIIGSYKNLTWSGNPDSTVTLNGTDNTVGTARTYNTAGAHVIETILSYSKPPAPGPYVEVHNTALLTVPVPAARDLQFYIPFDGTVVSSVCDGAASRFNFTAHYCASDATLAGSVLHMLHLTDAQTVGQFLGGQNFTSCAALGAAGAGNATGAGAGGASPTGIGGGPAGTLTPYNPTSGAVVLGVQMGLMAVLVAGVVGMVL